MINFNDVTKENIKEHNTNQPQIPHHPYVKDAYEAKYKFSINKRESTGSNHFNDSKDFIKYSNDMNDI